MKLSTYFPFYLIAIAIAIGLTVPVLIQDGMFSDAMLYTSVSHNMAIGQGSFWFPYYDEFNVCGLTSFHEQPPLVFYIQSWFFKILGSSIYTERVYTFLMMILNILLIHAIWKLAFAENKSMQSMSWLAIIFWITIPVCFWSYANCMQENTMSVFCLLGIYSTFNFYVSKKTNYLYLLLGGVFTVLAFLSKGFPGLFPITFPFIYWLISRKISFFKMMLDSSIVFSVVGLIFAMIYLSKDGHQSIYINYLQLRVLQRINEAHTVENRFVILGRLFSELIPILSAMALTYFISMKKKMTSTFFQYTHLGLLFFVIGLSGTLPLMLTKVQNGFYMVAALPYFGLGAACFIAPFIQPYIAGLQNKQFRIWQGLALIVFAAVVGLSISKIGKVSRDKDLMGDIYLIGKVIPKFTYMQINKKMPFEDWTFQQHLMRYFNIGLRHHDAPYLLTTKALPIEDPSQYTKLELPTLVYDVYQKK